MEARDTIMTEEQLEQIEKAYIDEDFSVNYIRLGRGHTEELRLRVAQAQAEISFKAGIKEGVEFIRFIITHLDSQYGFIKKLESSPDWQAKLKEWALSPSERG